jgi:hypothetical protein
VTWIAEFITDFSNQRVEQGTALEIFPTLPLGSLHNSIMGNDGGSIPRRIELVKEKKKETIQNPDIERRALWFYCALSKVRTRVTA